MTEASEIAWDDLAFPAGLRVLVGWQAGNTVETDRLKKAFDASFVGSFDDGFKIPAPQDAIHVSGSIDLKPVLHLSAPYSLAAAMFGKEQLITALTHEPDFVNRFLDHLADTVHKPWIDHFFSNHTDG